MIGTTVTGTTAVVEATDYGPLGRHDVDFARSLRDAVVDACDDDRVKSVVLRATGPDFCPSVDPVPPDRAALWTVWHQAFGTSSSVYQAVCFAKKVVVTEVTGECAGGGSALVLCSDLTVAADDARFGSPFGVVPESNFVLAALTMRLNRAKAWLVRDSVLSAAEARTAGLANVVVPAAEVAARVRGMTDAVGRMPLDGVTMSKMLQQAVMDAHGVGRDFDQAGFYASAMWSGAA